MKFGHAFLSIFVLFSLLMGLPTKPGISAPPPPDLQALLNSASQGKASIVKDERSGMARFISIPAENAVALDSSVKQGMDPQQAALGFAQQYGPLFGLDNTHSQLIVMRNHSGPHGNNFVRFQQHIAGVPVLAGELIVQTDASNRLLSMNGEVSAVSAVSTTPVVSAIQAEDIALALTAKESGYSQDKLQASPAQLWIYDPHLMNSLDSSYASLVWQVKVYGKSILPVSEMVLVDAVSSSTRLHFNQLDTVLGRVIYDNNNNSTLGLRNGSLERTENGPLSQIVDVNNAFIYSGDTYNFYLDKNDRDSLDGVGMALISTTRYCPDSYDCPYENAFWDDDYQQMVYGDGFASADDVVAHELTHGVTSRESNLFYYMQSGAINEALSDAWGEMVDLSNGHGNDSDAVRWKLGEDLTIIGGAIRDMKNPPYFGDPDSMTSPNYYCGEMDGGGVHFNSGVLNKAVYLMIDGDTFNGYTVNGIGIDKTSKILYELQTHLLTSGSEYSDLNNLLPQACKNLEGTDNISEFDCNQVSNVVMATAMDKQPSACASPDLPLTCNNGSPLTIFNDNFESGTAKWTFEKQISDPALVRWQIGSPYGSYARSGSLSLYADDHPALRTDASAAIKNSIYLDGGAGYYLQFAHAFDFEHSSTNYYDGGVVEYKTDENPVWRSLDSFFVLNGPNVVLHSGNALGARSGFGGVSHGYRSTRYDVSPLAGKHVTFRWRMGLDFSVYSGGWWVDDVNIYACSTAYPVYHLSLPVVNR